jgi:hypothetical protein
MVEGGSGEGFYGFYIRTSSQSIANIKPNQGNKIHRNLGKCVEIRFGRSLVMIASQQPYCWS